MPDQTASRTLVKSAPELWSECSDAAALTRHLGAFGDIRITRLEPETAVAWEGDATRGTVRLEPSGWGTRVILTTEGAPAEPRPPTPVLTPEPRRSLLGRLREMWLRPAEPEPKPAAPVKTSVSDALSAALDSLGSAHHRPYSRA